MLNTLSLLASLVIDVIGIKCYALLGRRHVRRDAAIYADDEYSCLHSVSSCCEVYILLSCTYFVIDMFCIVFIC